MLCQPGHLLLIKLSKTEGLDLSFCQKRFSNHKKGLKITQGNSRMTKEEGGNERRL